MVLAITESTPPGTSPPTITQARPARAGHPGITRRATPLVLPAGSDGLTVLPLGLIGIGGNRSTTSVLPASDPRPARTVARIADSHPRARVQDPRPDPGRLCGDEEGTVSPAGGARLHRQLGRLADTMIRLALAVRDSDGSPLIEPSRWKTFRHARYGCRTGRRAGLLAPVSPRDLEVRRPRHGPDPRHHDGQRARSCAYCLNSGIGSVCAYCLTWARRSKGKCSGCRRAGIPLRRRRCRACELRALGLGGPRPGSDSSRDARLVDAGAPFPVSRAGWL